MRKRMVAKTPSHFYVVDGHIVNSPQGHTNQCNGVDDQKGCRSSQRKDPRTYDDTPGDVTPYVKSYTFDVPQYHLGDVPFDTSTSVMRKKRPDSHVNKMAVNTPISNNIQTNQYDDKKGCIEDLDHIYETIPQKIRPSNHLGDIKALRSKQIDKKASGSHVHNRAASQVVKKTPRRKISNKKDQFDGKKGCSGDSETDYDSHTYETIPEGLGDYRKAHAPDVPQCHIGNIPNDINRVMRRMLLDKNYVQNMEARQSVASTSNPQVNNNSQRNQFDYQKGCSKDIHADYDLSYETVLKRMEAYESHTLDGRRNYLGDTELNARRKQIDKSAPSVHTRNIAARQSSENLESDYDSCTYETIPKQVEAYGESYAFDVPQYNFDDEGVDIKAIREALDKNVSHNNPSKTSTGSTVNITTKKDKVNQDSYGDGLETDSDYCTYETVP
uniref:Uncharacterized protein n=1 Tax=Branchiostoma floridae TaxID=7739 RepID=C3Y7P4_BRAFL|eukprot:XP_002607862.1 hypothetical protein BRAFLDRAFT_64063 [Branchiostoma floridae]